jgi:cobalt-zinc-cadmium efflux system outer membrane protein
VPIFDRHRSDRAVAQARLRLAHAEAEVVRRRVRADVTSWHAAVRDRRQVSSQYRDALDRVDQIERIAQISYEAGERGILDLLDAYRTTVMARVRQTELDAAVRRAEIELEFASGWEIP